MNGDIDGSCGRTVGSTLVEVGVFEGVYDDLRGTLIIHLY